jgi:thiamine-monophosphate kinase
MLVEGVHFRLEAIDPLELGRRALAISTSDIAAMGGSPTFALTSLALPPDTPLSTTDRLYRGIRDGARRFGVSVVGGNVARTQGPVTLDVTLLGAVPRDELVLRSGAQVGDLLLVTGVLGEATARRLLLEQRKGEAAAESNEDEDGGVVPEPRIALARAIASRQLAHAMIDLSDGLAGDVRHLARASGVGAVIDEENLPVSVRARRAAERLGLDFRELALNGGEDYELLIALPEDRLSEAREAAGEVPLFVVGTVVAPEHGILVERFGGARDPLPEGGWSHF